MSGGVSTPPLLHGGNMIKITHRAVAVAACGFVGLAVTPAQADDYVQFSTGLDYSSGDYGEAVDTDMLAIPFGVKVQRGNFTLRASVPYVEVEGPEGIIPGDGGVTPGTPLAPVTKRKGLGDTNVSAGYSFNLGQATLFEVTGKIKLPTGSKSKFLSTGTTDFTVQGELTQGFGNTFVAARAGRRFNGSSALYPLQDVWLAGGGMYHVAGPVTLGLDYDWREGSLPTSPDRSEATASMTYKTSPALLVQGYAYKGFADGSPDLGGGLQLLYRFAM
jgi:hypothetical protein